MQNLSNLITWARQRGRWSAAGLGRALSMSSLLHAAFGPCRLPAPVPLPVRVPRLRRLIWIPALLVAGLCIAPSADAARSSRFELTADGRLVDVQVLVGGEATPLYMAQGRWDRRYVQALKGRNYALAVTNNTGRRIGVLIAVDGLNVVNGQRSRLAADEAMYVLDPWERSVIRGWRSSLNDVRKFVFVDEQRSYAERTGQANGDMGWIRVLAFNEAGHTVYDPPGRINGREPAREQDEERAYGERQKDGAPAPRAEPPVAQGAPEAQEGGEARKQDGANKSMARDDSPSAPSVPGTGWGERRWDPVRRVWFVPQRQATDHLVFRYEYTSGLRALGIEPRGSRDRLYERERGELGFAQPPRW
jgi:hypothetical protein